MTGCRISKVTDKKTGKVIKIISRKKQDTPAIEILQDALEMVRERKIEAIGVFVKSRDQFWSDYCGRTDDLLAGHNHLGIRINDDALKEM